MGGKEVMARLLKIDPQVKAIVSSGYSDDPVMANFQTYGFTDVIAKPYRIAELDKVLKNILLYHVCNTKVEKPMRGDQGLLSK